jgi:hypothetical protein
MGQGEPRWGAATRPQKRGFGITSATLARTVEAYAALEARGRQQAPATASWRAYRFKDWGGG